MATMRLPDKESDARLLTLEEVAAYLGRSKRSIYRYAKDGAIRGQKVGGKWMFDAADVEEWLGVKPNPSSPVAHAPSEWEREFGPKFQAFVRGLGELEPDYLVFMERKAAKLVGYLGGVPAEFMGTVLMYDALKYLHESDIQGKFFVVIDDTVQHGRSLRQTAQALLDKGARNVLPIAFASCIDGAADSEPGAIEIRSHLDLPEDEFSRFTAGTIDFLKSLRSPLDVDHPVVELGISVENADWVARLLQFLSQFGDVFFVPTPAEKDRVLELTLHKPSFFAPLPKGLPSWVQIDDWYKLRIQVSVDPPSLVLVPIVIASVKLSEYRGGPCGLADMPSRTCERVDGYWDQDADDRALHCRRCMSNHLAAILLEKFMRLLVQAERSLKLYVSTANVTNREDLQMMYGVDAGRAIATDLEGHAMEPLSAGGRSAPAQAIFPGVVELRATQAAIDKRSLGGWIEALPLVGLLADHRLQAEGESHRLADRWRGLTIGEIGGALKDKGMTELQISRSVDFMLDNSVIVPHDYIREEDGLAVRGFVAGELNRGSYDAFLPDAPLGGAAKEGAALRFGKDMVRIPLALDLAMGHFGFKDGVVETIAEKLLATLLLDGIIPSDDSFLSRTAGRYGATVHSVSGPAGAKEYLDLRTLSRYGPFLLQRSAQRAVYRPTPDWSDRLGQLQGRSDEITSMDQHVQFLSDVFTKASRGMNRSSDALVILASCRDESLTYFHVHKDLTLWVTDFYELLELLSDKAKRRLKDPKRVLEYTASAADQVAWKIDSFGSLASLAESIDGLYPRIGAMQERARAVLSTLKPPERISERLEKARRLGLAMRALSALAAARLDGDLDVVGAAAAVCAEAYTLVGLTFPVSKAATLADVDDTLRHGFGQLSETFSMTMSPPSKLQADSWDEIDLLQLNVDTRQAMRELGIETSGVFLYIDGCDSTLVTANAPSELELEGNLAVFYRDIRRDILGEHQGEMLKNNGGDDCVVIFKNAEDAIRAAAAIRASAHAAYVAARLPWPIRMGMDAGEVYQETFSRTSSAISIASHLADKAEPWGILVARDVKEAMVDCPLPLRERPPLDFGDTTLQVYEIAEGS